MASLSAVYADALFDLAMEKGEGAEYMSQAIVLRDALKDPECAAMLSHPHISAAQKRGFFEKILSGHIHDNLLGFLFLAVDKNRETFIVPALDELIRKIEQSWRKTTANVVSAHPLSEEQISTLAAKLAKKLDKEVSVNVIVDPSVIGGIYVHVDGHLFDRTIKTQLRELSDNLLTNH